MAAAGALPSIDKRRPSPPTNAARRRQHTPPVAAMHLLTVDSDEEDNHTVILTVGPTTIGPSLPRSKPFITTVTTSTIQIRRGSKPTLITPELAAPVRDKADDRRCLRRRCRRTSITPPPVLARQVSRLHAAASRPSHPSPNPDCPSRCPSPLQRMPTSPSLPTLPSVTAATRPSAHIACMHRPTASLICHHVTPSSFTLAACWHVGMGVASPRHPTATTDVECIEHAVTAT
ncbi:hypothetical protein ACLOJK_036428, partial [Asimina triloba]